MKKCFLCLSAMLLSISFDSIFAFGDESPSNQSSMKAAIEKAISFECSSEEIRNCFVREMPLTIDEKLQILGRNNLSSFLLGVSPDFSGQYELKIPLGADKDARIGRISAILSQLREGKALAQIENIKNVEWEEGDGGFATGSFTVHQVNVWLLRCLFSAQKTNGVWKIVKLVIPKINSSSQEGAYVVFDLTDKQAAMKTRLPLGISPQDKTGALDAIQKSAMLRAISFEGTPRQIADTITFIKDNRAKLGHLMIPYLKSKLGSRNLSSFIFYIQDSFDAYQIEEMPHKHGWKARWDDIFKILEGGKSLVQFDDLSEVHWQETNDNTASGSFTYYRESIYRIKCLFMARKEGAKWIVNRLAIAKKGSDKIEDALEVFDIDKESNISDIEDLEDILPMIEMKKLQEKKKK